MFILRRLLQILGWSLLAVLAWLVFVQTVVRLVRRFWHFPAPAVVALFLDSRVRRALQPPEQVVGWLDIRDGMQVLELGPGPGTFTVEAARRAGPSGRVYAVDIQPAMITRLSARLRAAGVENVDARVASAYELPFPDQSLDRAFMITVLAEIPDRQRALRELWRVLKPDGLLGVGELLLDPDYPRRSTVTRWCEAAGFVPAGGWGPAWHYMLLFRPRHRAGGGAAAWTAPGSKPR